MQIEIKFTFILYEYISHYPIRYIYIYIYIILYFIYVIYIYIYIYVKQYNIYMNICIY